MSWRESVPNFARGIFYILLSLGHYSNAIKPVNRFLVHPDEVLYRDEGSNVVFEWDFHIGSRTKVIEFLFGEWAFPGYVRKKILNVQGHNQVKKRREFEKKVDWRGNVYKCVTCTAVVVMYNLTRADFKSYGVGIELGVDRSPLTNSLLLVQTEPASITKWTQNIAVQEGNSTTIECRASGLPPPYVKIKRNNQTLRICNDMKPCVFKIQAATFEDQGEYVCLVQQGNYSVSRSLNVTVLKTRKAWVDKTIAADLASNETIRGFYGEKLDILCPLHFPNIAEFEQRIILFINRQPMIIMYFKNKTPAIHCTLDHPYEKMCQTQMINSYADKNNVHFVIDKVPENLNGSTSECVTDHDDLDKGTRRDPPRTIVLKDTITTSTRTIPVASTKGMNPQAPKENLVWLWILLGVFGFIIIIVVCWCTVYRCCPDQLPSECCRKVCQCIWCRCRREYEAATADNLPNEHIYIT